MIHVVFTKMPSPSLQVGVYVYYFATAIYTCLPEILIRAADEGHKSRPEKSNKDDETRITIMTRTPAQEAQRSIQLGSNRVR
ncbi:hypothetical protein BJX96DRAFT_156706 [Aspergillus floccosus]